MNDPGDNIFGESTTYPGQVPSSVTNGANGHDVDGARIFTEPRPIGYEATFATIPPAPKVLIPGILPCEVFGLVGPGGTAKTTFTLWLMISIILDRTIFERKVNKPGPCLFISAEDNADIIRYRVNRLCNALRLTEEQQRKVAAELHIEDITGKLVRFIEVDSHNNLGFTNFPDEIIEAYRDTGIRMSVCDPAAYFGAGERFINDNEALLMQAGRKIQQGLGGGAFGYIHHTGQSVAREGITDQYAGRGGSAFADNSRGMLVMQQHKNNNDNNFDLPRAISVADVTDGRVIRLHIAKFSVGPREMEPLWVLRGKDDPWTFNCYDAQRVNGEKKVERAQANIATEEDAAVMAVVAHVEAERKKERYPTRADVRGSKFPDNSGRTVPNLGKYRLIDIAIQEELLVEVDLPDHLKRGMKKKYLDITAQCDPPDPDRMATE